MKQVSKFFAPVALAAAAFCAPQAYAAGQFASISTYLGNGTYIGIMDPTVLPVENATIQSSSVPVNSSFTDWWVVDINPTGNVAASLSFLNIGSSFSAFSVSLFQVSAGFGSLGTSAYTCASASMASGATLCPTGPGALTAVSTATSAFGIGGQSGAFLANTTSFLTAGRYAVRITGTTGGGSNPSYSGQIQVNQVPEPGSLALAGLALLGAAAAMRKRKSA